MKKKMLAGLLLCIILFAGCDGVKPGLNTLPNRGSTASNAASPSPGLVQGEKAAASPSASLPKGDAADAPTPSEALPQETGSDKEVFEIKEKMFIAQCNDIYLNPEDYKGKTVKLEGMYDEFTDPETNETYRYVYRNGPGCCGNDGVAGFEFLYDGTPPRLNDWIEVTGTVEIMKEDDYEYVVLRLSKLAVLDERGAEYVEN